MNPHAATYERTPTGYVATCRCGWSHAAPVKAGAIQWYGKHRRHPEAACPTEPNETCGKHLVAWPPEATVTPPEYPFKFDRHTYTAKTDAEWRLQREAERIARVRAEMEAGPDAGDIAAAHYEQSLGQ